MTPTLIVLVLLALGVGIVAFATRRPPSRAKPTQADPDTAWNDPITPAGDDPFARATDPAPTAPATDATPPPAKETQP
ncbi:MAG: hypothetical protein KKA16_00810 [Alphaproteobacteria bacterium]|nr:hypothetical protein [Alphaproteobacteria bacterium]MBU2379286.1 hypothetical protein [Alphaproteobacteria bacterium]